MEPERNTLFSIEDIGKMFSERYDILYARQLASEEVDDKKTR